MIDRIICFIILVWIGLYNQGMCYYHPSMNKIMLYNKKMINGDWKGKKSVVCSKHPKEKS